MEHEFRLGKRRTEWVGEILEKSEYLPAALRPQSHPHPYQSRSQWPGARRLTRTRCAEKQWQAARVMGKGLWLHLPLGTNLFVIQSGNGLSTGTQSGTPRGAYVALSDAVCLLLVIRFIIFKCAITSWGNRFFLSW